MSAPLVEARDSRDGDHEDAAVPHASEAKRQSRSDARVEGPCGDTVETTVESTFCPDSTTYSFREAPQAVTNIDVHIETAYLYT